MQSVIISCIQDIEIINTFYNRVSDIKTVEEIIMKKSKTVADLVTVIDVCIEVAEESSSELLITRNIRDETFHIRR
jgi:hypothetical protein